MTDPIAPPEAVADVPAPTLDDLHPTFSYPLGLVKGTVTAPDGRVIQRTRIDVLHVRDALTAALADPAAPEVEGTL